MGTMGSRVQVGARRGVVGLFGAALTLAILGAAVGESAVATPVASPPPGTVIPVSVGTDSLGSQHAATSSSATPQAQFATPNGPTPVSIHPDGLAPAGLSPYDGQLRILAVTHAANWLCYGVEGVATGWSDRDCIDMNWTHLTFSVSVPSGDSYYVWGYEVYGNTGANTDYVYANNTGADSRLRSNATAYPAFPANYPEFIPEALLRLDLQPWKGSRYPTGLQFTSSVDPVYVGAVTTLTVTVTGDSGVPTGAVDLYDDKGHFLGDGVLSGGVVSIRHTVTHAAPGFWQLRYRGDATYAGDQWSITPDFLPTIDGISPGFGPTAGGTLVTITGIGFLTATQVTFGGVAGTGLQVTSDTSLTVTTPAGASLRSPVVVSTAVADSIAGDPGFFAYTEGSVVAGVPAGIADVSGFTPGVVRCFQVTGKAGVPVGAVGVTLNVTASLPNAPGHVRIYPDYNNDGASPAPLVSTVNFEANRDVANSTTISLPADGKVCAYGVGGTMSRLILDVESYTLPGSGINLITPEKLIDTRSQAQYHVGPINGPVEPMTDYTVQVAGVGSVPVGAMAVMVNITAVDTNTPGHLRMWAADQSMPNTSVVNYAPETKANSQIVALSADGKLKFRSFSYAPTSVSPVQILIDVTGYITAGSDFTATAPTTVVETRPSYTPVGLPGAPLNPNTIYPVTLGDTNLVPAGATAVVLNVTVVQPTGFGHIRVYPDTNGLGTTPAPVMSNINFIPGRDIPNMVIVQLPPDRTIDFYTVYLATGRTDLKADLIGYIKGTPG